MAAEVAAAVSEHGLECGDCSMDVGGVGLRARGALLGQNLFVLALLGGVAAMLLSYVVARLAIGRVAFALLVAASSPLLTLGRQFVSFACLLEPLLLSLVSLTILPQLPGKRLPLRHA